MALIIEDRIMETSTTTGTGALTLAGAYTGYKTFASVCTSPSDTCYYLIEAVDANGYATGEWETGLGTYSAASTLTRTTVSRSSNANAAVSFAAGTKRVSITTIGVRLKGPTLIGETVTASSATNVSFASIAGIYRDLEVRVRGRGTLSATLVDIRMRFNGDTAANYDYEVQQGNNTTNSNSATSGSTSAYIGNIAAATATASYGDMCDALVGDYRGTTFHKPYRSLNGTRSSTVATTFYNDFIVGGWRSTAAITQVDVFPSSGGFVDGSVVSLYGLF